MDKSMIKRKIYNEIVDSYKALPLSGAIGFLNRASDAKEMILRIMAMTNISLSGFS